jgi:RloB-like protein
VKNTRDSADQLLVICGAETTELDYLRGFNKHFKHPTLSVKVTPKPGSPLQVVRYAIKRWRGPGDEFDQIWCVVDVDEYQDLAEAQQLAKDHDIELVVSNPCFELFLLLHHTDHRGWVPDHDALKVLLQKHVEVPPDKTVNFDRDYGGDRWRIAAERARALTEEGQEHTTNPSTRMWRLVLTINGPS